MLQIGQIFYGILVIGFTYLFCRFLQWRYFLYTLFKLPGPKRLPILDNLLDMITLDHVELFARARYWGQKYGPAYVISAIGRPAVNICGPDEFEVVASTMKHIQKGRVYDLLKSWLGEGLLTSTGAHWQQRRKILTPAFHFSILQQFIQIFNNETAKLVEKLNSETKTTSSPIINVLPLMSQTTLYTIAETSFGTKIDEDNVEDKKYISSIHQIGDIITYRIIRPWLFSKTLFNILSSLGAKYNNLVKTLHSFTNKIIDEKAKTFKPFEVPDDAEKSSYKKKLTFLDLLLNAKISDGIIDDKGVRDEVNTFMFEGHDTTAMAISFTLMLLANHKHYQDLLYEEITSVLGDESKEPNLSDLNELKLMDRVIKEALRLYPSVPFISRILETDVILNGYFVPKETIINVWISEIHRNPKFWNDPEKFDPDRFLPENSVGRHPYSYVPFSAGPRNCIGQKFAVLELKAMLCGILRNFVLEPVDTPDSIRIIIDLVLRTEGKSLKVKFTPRKSSL